MILLNLPTSLRLSVKDSACNAGDPRRSGFSLWVGQIPWRRKWQSTLVFLSVKIPWIKEPNRLQSMGLQRVGHDFLSCANWWCQDFWGILCWSLSCPYLSFVLSMNGSTTAKIESKLPPTPPPHNALSHKRKGGGGGGWRERKKGTALGSFLDCQCVPETALITIKQNLTKVSVVMFPRKMYMAQEEKLPVILLWSESLDDLSLFLISC